MLFRSNLKKKAEYFFSNLDETINTITFPTYVISLVIIHVFYFFAFFGIVYVNPGYIRELTVFLECVVCFFLLFRFNPFRKPKIDSFDVKIIFSSALFLLTNIGVADFLYVYLEKTKATIQTKL